MRLLSQCGEIETNYDRTVLEVIHDKKKDEIYLIGCTADMPGVPLKMGVFNKKSEAKKIIEETRNHGYHGKMVYQIPKEQYKHK